MVDIATISIESIREILDNVMDPEVPVLSILDLGIVRDIQVHKGAEGPQVTILITPTYSGCPAMDMIATNIKIELLSKGYPLVQVKQVLSPAWTTDWMTEKGRRQLKEYGIAPPNARQQVCHPDLFAAEEAVQCPHCESYHTHLLSEFGSTACKSLYKCDECKEPFDYFKCH